MSYYFTSQGNTGDPDERYLTFASYGHRDDTKADVETTKAHTPTTRYTKKKRK